MVQTVKNVFVYDQKHNKSLDARLSVLRFKIHEVSPASIQSFGVSSRVFWIIMNDKEKALKKFQKRRDAASKKALERFPKPSAKLRYRGTNKFWFTDIIANAERELSIGEIYTLKSIELASSWACVTLEETGDIEFSLGFFDDLSASNQNT